MLLVSSESPEQSIPLLSIDLEAPVANPNRSIYEVVVGNFGCFPGWKKMRLDLSPCDKAHTYSLALLNEADISASDQNKTWVYVLSSTGPVAANVSSIAKRLCFKDKDEVIDLALRSGKNPPYTALEETIQAKMNAYEQDFKTLDEFFNKIRNCCRDARKTEDVLICSDWDKEINDPEIETLSHKFLKACSSNLIFSDDTLEVNRLLKEFKLNLAALNSNFASFVREKVVEDRALWGQYDPNLLVDTKARKIGEDSTGEAAVRLKIDSRRDLFYRYAIKTDGYIYYDKPQMTDDYVPYSGDGKTWVMLKIKSLHYRTGIPVDAIRTAAGREANAEGGLFLLLTDKMSLLNQGSLHCARENPEEDSPYLLPQNYNWSDIFCQITKYLPIESLKALEMVNSEYKADVDCAILAEARLQGYQGEDINEANQFLKNEHEEMYAEMFRFRERFPIYAALYKMLFRFRTQLPSNHEWEQLFNFGSEEFPRHFFKVVKTLNDVQLFFLFSDIPYLAQFAPRLAKKLLRDRGDEVLRLSIIQREEGVLKKLLESGVQTNTFDCKGYSPLHLAVLRSDEYVQWLLRRNADMNVRGFGGNTPLHLAILKSAAGSVEALLRYKARLDIKNEQGERAIDFLKNEEVARRLWFAASGNGYRKIIRLLLKCGFDVNAVDIAGNTALHVAALNGQNVIMEVILNEAKGIDFELKNLPGDRVEDIVRKQVSKGRNIPIGIRGHFGIESTYDKAVEIMLSDEFDLGDL